jgi:hypothetical protein
MATVGCIKQTSTVPDSPPITAWSTGVITMMKTVEQAS